MIAHVEKELKRLSRVQMAEKDWNRTQLATEAEVHPNSVSDFFSKEVHLPKTTRKILNSLGIELVPRVKKEES